MTLVIATILLHSGTHHLLNPYAFLASVYQYEIVGQTGGKVIAATLPFVEITVAICLLARVMSHAAWHVATGLFTVFAAVQISALSRGLDIACGCFGPLQSQPVSFRSLAFAALLLVGSAAMPILLGSSKRIDT